MGSTLIDIRPEGTPAPAAVAPAAPVSFQAPVAPAVEFSRQAGIPATEKVQTTPAVRKMAREHKIDLHQVRGTGPKGRIVKEDVMAFLAGKQAPVVAAPAQPKSTAVSSPSTVSTAAAGKVDKGDQRVPIRGIQRLMVKSMTESLQVRTPTPSLTANLLLVCNNNPNLHLSVCADPPPDLLRGADLRPPEAAAREPEEGPGQARHQAVLHASGHQGRLSGRLHLFHCNLMLYLIDSW